MSNKIFTKHDFFCCKASKKAASASFRECGGFTGHGIYGFVQKEEGRKSQYNSRKEEAGMPQDSG